MAQPDITATLGIEVGNVDKIIADLSRKVERLQKEIGKKTKLGVDTKESESRFERASRLANDAVNKQKKALQELALSGKKGSKEWNTIVAKMEKGVKAQRAVKKATDATENALKGINSKLDLAGKKTTKFQQLMGKAGGVAKSAFGGGLAGGLLGGGLAGIATSAISQVTQLAGQAFDEYKQLNTNIQNIGTLGASNALTGEAVDLGKFESLITDLSTKVPDKASDIANGVYQAISAGITGTERDIVSFVETASKVAVAGLSDTESAVNGITSITNAYGLGAEGANFAADSLFAAIKAGKTSFGELNSAMANVVPTASSLKIGFDTVAGTLAVLTARGVPTAQASTALNSAFIELAKPGAELAKVLKASGLEVSKMEEYLKDTSEGGIGLTGVLDKVKEGLDKTGTSVNKAFVGVRSKTAINSLFSDLDKAKDTINGVVNDVAEGGVAEGAYKAASKGIQVQLDIIRNQIQAGFNSAFQSVVPIASKAFTFISDIVGPILSKTADAFKNLWEEIKVVVMPILAVIGGAILTSFVTGIKLGQSILQGLLRIATRVFSRIREALEPIISKFGLFTDGMGDNIDMMEVFKNVIQSVFSVVDDFVDIIVELAGFIIEILVTAFEAVAEVIGFVIGLFQSNKKEVEENEGFLKKLVKAFGSVKQVMNNIKGTIGGLTASFKALKDGIKTFIDTLFSKNFLDVVSGDFWKSIGEDIGDAYDEGFNRATGKIADGVVEAFDGVNAEGTVDANNIVTGEEEVIAGAEETGKKVASALQKATEAYKQAQKENALSLQEETNRINQLQGVSEKYRAELLRQAQFRANFELTKEAERIFKATTNDYGELIKSGVKLTGKETVAEIRKIFADLRTAGIKVTVVPVVEKLDPYAEMEKVLSEVDPLNVDADMGFADDVLKEAEEILANVNFDPVPKNAIANAFASGLDGLSEDIAKAFESNVDESSLREQESGLQESLKNRTIAFHEYSEGIREINQSLAEDDPLSRIFDGVASAGARAFGAINETMEPVINGLAEGIATKTHKIEDTFGVMAVGVASSMAQMALSGEVSIKGLLLSMLDALQAMVPIIIAQLFGLYSASPNPVNIFGLGVPGVAAAGAVGAVFTSLVQIARGVVNSSFNKGVVGIDSKHAPIGTDTIPARTTWGADIMVDRGESILTRKATRRGKNAQLFKWLNRTGGDALDWLLTQNVSRTQLDRDLNLASIGISFEDVIRQGALLAHEANVKAERRQARRDDAVVRELSEVRAEVRKLREEEGAIFEQKVQVEPVINDGELIDRIDVKQSDYAGGW